MSDLIQDLIQRYLEGRVTSDEIATLQQALLNDPKNRALFLDYVNLDEALWAAADASAEGTRSTEKAPATKHTLGRLWLAAAACLILLLFAGFLTHHQPSPPWPSVAEALDSSRNAIAQMPPPSASPLPLWISPTASLLNQPHLP